MTEAEELELLELEALAARLKNGTGGGQIIQPVNGNPVDAGEAARLGFAQGGTAFFGDEIGGAGGSMFMKSPVRLGPAAQPSPDDTPEVRKAKEEALAQQEARPSNREVLTQKIRDRNDQAEREQGAAYLGGAVLGGVASSVAPGLGQAKTLGQFVKHGAAYGAAAGLGDSDANLLKGEFGEAAKDTAVGAGMGAALAPVGFALAKVAPQVVRAVGEKLKAIGIGQARRTMVSGALSMSKKKVADEAVEEALRSGAVLPFGTTSSIANRLEGKTEALGKVYGEIVEDLQRAGLKGPEAAEVARRLLAEAQKLESETLGSSVPNFYRRLADEATGKPPAAGRIVGEAGELIDLPKQSTIPLGQAEAIKRNLQREAKNEYNKVGGDTILGEAKKKAASVVRQSVEDTVRQQAKSLPADSVGREAAESFVPVKQRLGRLLQAEEAAQRGAQRSENRSSTGLGGQIAAANVDPMGAVGSLLWNAAKERLGSAAATGSYWTGRGVGAPAIQRSAQRANASYGLTDALLEALNGTANAPLTPDQQALIEALQPAGRF